MLLGFKTRLAKGDIHKKIRWGFPGGSDSKGSFCNAGDMGSIPGLGRSPGKRTAVHSGTLACRIPRTVEPGRHSPWHCKESDVTELLTLWSGLVWESQKTRENQLVNLSLFKCLHQWPHSMPSSSLGPLNPQTILIWSEWFFGQRSQEQNHVTTQWA